MEEEIKHIYKTLSGGKEIRSSDHIIHKKDFTSIMADRFDAELIKRGIKWNGNSVTFDELISGVNSVPGKILPQETKVLVQNDLTENKEQSIGIDLQVITDLPTSSDYWEDDFYKQKFTPAEIGYCVKKQDPRMSFAGLYAVKEAIIKCGELKWSDIQIEHDENEKPFLNDYAISISHTSNIAGAVALKKDKIQKDTETVVQPSNMTNVKENDKGKSIKLYWIVLLIIIAYLIFRDLRF